MVSFRGFWEGYIFALWNIWDSIILLLPYDFLSVNGKVTVWNSTCLFLRLPPCQNSQEKQRPPPSPTISHSITQSSMKIKLICKVPQTAGTGPQFFFPPPKHPAPQKNWGRKSKVRMKTVHMKKSRPNWVPHLLNWSSSHDFQPHIWNCLNCAFTAGSYISSNQV